MKTLINGGRRNDVLGVLSLFGAAVVLSLGMLVGLPLLARVDPVGPNVLRHRLRAAFCKPRIEDKLECLHECAAEQGEDYRQRSCEQLPASSPSDADQQRLEAALFETSPCAQRCAVSWKTHSVWCAQGLEKAKLDATDACIFEGATLGLFEWKEARCQARCPESRPTDPLYLSSADTCMLTCLAASLSEPSPHDLRQLVQGLRKETDYRVKERIRSFAEPAVPPSFEALRRSCRLQHSRAPYDRSLDEKRAKERSCAACVREGLDAAR